MTAAVIDQRLTGFCGQVNAGEILQIWQKSASSKVRSRIEVRVSDGECVDLDGPQTGDFQMSQFVASNSGKVEISWDAGQTLVSLCYAYHPQRVLHDGIRILWMADAAKAKSRRNLLHHSPPFGWMNDPNGLIELGGRTHLFYQHYPHALQWNTMHWGHAVSDNLIDWTHLPVFLHPRTPLLSSGANTGGAFSGTAIAREEGGLRIFHTDREDERLPAMEWQVTAVSSDLITADASGPIITETPKLPGFGRDLRDPFVFKGPDGLWKMLLGGADQEAALILLYETSDAAAATGWRLSSVLHREGLERPVPAECPCLMALDGEGDGLCTLIFGLVGHRVPVNGRLNPSFALIGRFDGRRFQEISRQELDFGGDFYAFQGFHHQGRPIGMAWAANWAYFRRGHDFPTAATFPRRLVWRNGALHMPPVEAVSELRLSKLNGNLRVGVVLPDGLAELDLSVSGGEAWRLIFAHSAFPMSLAYEASRLELVCDWPVPRNLEMHRVTETKSPKRIRVFIDVGLIEIFIDDGRLCATKRFDSDEPVSSVRMIAEPGVIERADLWQLRPQRGAQIGNG